MRLFMTALIAVLPSVVLAAPVAPQIETFTLGNGLQVAFVRTDTAPVVTVQLWYHAGSKDEPRERRGTAHMFEHLMVRGTTHVRDGAHQQFLTALGGTTAGQTEEDATHFVDTLPAEYMDFAIQLEAERMRNLLFRKDVIDATRDLIKDEVKQREAQPLARGFLRLLAIAFTKHPYAWDAGGNLKDLDAITVDDLKKFYDAYYQPNNALLVVVGKTTLEQVKSSAEKWFGSMPKAGEPPRPWKDAAEPEQTAKKKETGDANMIPLTVIGWHTPAAKNPDIIPLQLTSIILGAGDSARLKARLKTPDPKTKQPLALEAGAEAVIREDPGLIVALGAYRDPAQADAVEAALIDEVGKLGTGGPTDAELRKAKNQIESAFTFSLDSAQGYADAMGRSWILTGDPKTFIKDVERIEKVTAADVQRVVKTYLKPERATVVVLPPRK
jgi:zinc protease